MQILKLYANTQRIAKITALSPPNDFIILKPWFPMPPEQQFLLLLNVQKQFLIWHGSRLFSVLKKGKRAHKPLGLAPVILDPLIQRSYSHPVSQGWLLHSKTMAVSTKWWILTKVKRDWRLTKFAHRSFRFPCAVQTWDSKISTTMKVKGSVVQVFIL